MTDQPQQFTHGFRANGYVWDSVSGAWLTEYDFNQRYPAPPQSKKPWAAITIISVAALVVVGGCTAIVASPTPGTDPAVQSYQDTYTAPPAQVDPPVNSNPEEDLMNLVWEQQSASDRASICAGWNTAAQSDLLDAFMSGISDSSLSVTREQARQFFDRKCS